MIVTLDDEEKMGNYLPSLSSEAQQLLAEGIADSQADPIWVQGSVQIVWRDSGEQNLIICNWKGVEFDKGMQPPLPKEIQNRPLLI